MRNISPIRTRDLGGYPVEGILPPMLTTLYGFRRLLIANMAAFGVEPKNELPPLPQLKQQLAAIQRHLPQEKLVLRHPSIPLLYQNAFIKEGIPYQETGSGSLFFPFMGLHYTGVTEARPMSPLAQQIALHLIAAKSKRLYSHGLAERFGVTAMAVSAALKTLSTLPPFKRGKEGRLLYLETEATGNPLFEQLRTKLFTPVQARAYLHEADVPGYALPAGESALSKLTDLAAPRVPIVAIAKKAASGLPLLPSLPAWEGYVQVELWRYTPLILAHNGTVDPYSLALSLEDVDDPRLIQATEQLLHQLS